MNVGCSHCGTVFRVDPAKVPAGGVQARCSVCSGLMQVSASEELELPGPPPTAAPAPPSAVLEPPTPAPAPPTAATAPATAAPAPQPTSNASAGAPAASAAPPARGPESRTINPFLSRDPGVRAKRLARALISDMVTYYPAKHEEGLRDGTLKVLFGDEIRKSHEEYVGQVGAEFAQSTTYFQDSLNELLADGKKVF